MGKFKSITNMKVDRTYTYHLEAESEEESIRIWSESLIHFENWVESNGTEEITYVEEISE
jgi:hypothetical protein